MSNDPQNPISNETGEYLGNVDEKSSVEDAPVEEKPAPKPVEEKPAPKQGSKKRS